MIYSLAYLKEISGPSILERGSTCVLPHTGSTSPTSTTAPDVLFSILKGNSNVG